MDMYLSSGLMHDSFQEMMLEHDIKQEIDSVLGGADLSLSLGDLPPLELEDHLSSIGNDMPSWLTANGGGLLSHGSNSCQSVINGEFGLQDPGSLMVDPSHVMPVLITPSTSSEQIIIKKEPEEQECIIKTEPEEEIVEADEIETDAVYLDSDAEDKILTFTHHGFYTTKRANERIEPLSTTIATTTAAATKITTTTTTPSQTVTIPTQIQLKKQTSLLKTDSTTNHSSLAIKVTQPSTQQTGNILLQVHPQPTVVTTQANKRQRHQYLELDIESKNNRPYPKPAYSYSCLIAMALKNSSTGSLPVSEIYNFMCEHFPYFKTAPNGWKNSVRHNLSLNKCFEKIEKPAGNGSQRKGCLWAMNPAKIAKMDEEVHKWSKKDPLAIRKAMIFPENLELLERGELKRPPRNIHNHVISRNRSRVHHTVVSTTNNIKVCGGSEGDDDDTEEEEEEEEEEEVVDEVDEDTGNEDIEQEDLDDEEADQQYRVREYMQLAGLAPADNDSYDDASLTDFEIEVADTVFEELDSNDEGFNLGVCLSSSIIEAPLSKRSKLELATAPVSSTPSTIQGNYVYKPMVSWGINTQKATAPTQRRKTPILLRTPGTASSLIKVEDP